MNTAFLVMMLLSVIRLSTPTFVAGVGNMFCERVGILNLGCEGMLVSGAFCAVLGSYLTGNPWIGVLCGILGGGAAAAIHGIICIEFGGIHAISGLGLNMFSLGLTTFLCSAIFKSNISPKVNALNNIEGVKDIPVIGFFLYQLSPLVFAAVAIAVMAYVAVFKTPLGMRIRAVGDDPKVVETAGIDVWKTKYLGIIICGLICGLAGSYMALGQLDRFVKGMTSGKGMLAVIAVKMGRWNPIGIMGTALLLGFFDALQLQLQFNSTVKIPPELIQILPFAAGIVVLSFQQSGNDRPGSLDLPYLRNRFKY
jgi:simple sugar transport system permease protein